MRLGVISRSRGVICAGYEARSQPHAHGPVIGSAGLIPSPGRSSDLVSPRCTAVQSRPMMHDLSPNSEHKARTLSPTTPLHCRRAPFPPPSSLLRVQRHHHHAPRLARLTTHHTAEAS
ncbi:hypothetical protein NDU88_005708 [Pleurodeles waltl]|uniref:Uncharacterized protein n=1 Tax=Pleurodeles waltl TaxID=8319 RepID=A0AAV7N1B9_PLEWA|nr:hypothetical protein NDU88_005708 [Pleurodeles waltl]